MLQRFLDDPLMWSGLRVGLLGVLGLVVTNLGIFTTGRATKLLGRWFQGSRSARWAKEDRASTRLWSDLDRVVRLAGDVREFFGAGEATPTRYGSTFVLSTAGDSGTRIDGNRFASVLPPSQWRAGDVLRCRRNSNGVVVVRGDMNRRIESGDLVRIAGGQASVGQKHFAIEGGNAGVLEDFEWVARPTA
jgi:hypothetical protein